MLVVKEYNRTRAVAYARRWAFDRSPLFESYNGIGGDCTNFVSQCLYAGSCVMNYTRDFGWYYLSPRDRAPAWTGVEFFYDFITGNARPSETSASGVGIGGGEGPFGVETYPGGLELGDVIQLGNEDGDYYHTLIVTDFSPDGYLISAHSNDALDRPLSTYEYFRIRYLHIEGVRVDVPDDVLPDCFQNFYAGDNI